MVVKAKAKKKDVKVVSGVVHVHTTNNYSKKLKLFDLKKLD